MTADMVASQRPAPPREDGDNSRTTRLLALAREIRQNPHQTRERLWARFGIGKTQFYKDRRSLAQIGFQFEYAKNTGFTIIEDRLTPIVGLSFTDRLVLMFALEHLCSTGEGTLGALAVEVGRKLVGGLDSPFRERLQECFDRQITENGFGVRAEIFSFIREAISDSRRIRILYKRSGDWTIRWREIDPMHLYLRQRTLYLYARTVDETPPQWKVFRVSRIQEVRYTGMHFAWNPDDDGGFWERQNNAFLVFMGSKTRKVVFRFTGQARHYVAERQWHSSQVLEDDGESLFFTVHVAEPQEVVRWARQFGEEAELVEIEAEDSDAQHF